jgi:hypothetical protein
MSLGRQALERGGDSPEGALGPRARRRFTRGGARPSSEAEFKWRGAWSSSEAETHPRGTATDRLVGRCGFFGPWAFPLWVATTRSVFLGFAPCSFAFYYFFEKGVFPGY